MYKVCEMWSLVAPSVWADTAPVRVRAPRPGESTAGGAPPIRAVAPLVLILVFVGVAALWAAVWAALWAAVLLCIRVIALVRVHAGVRLVPRALRADITATVLAVLLVLAVVSKQLLLGDKQQHDHSCKNHCGVDIQAGFNLCWRESFILTQGMQYYFLTEQSIQRPK